MIQSAKSQIHAPQAQVQDQDIRDISLVLLRKFGSSALDVAEDFAAEHRAVGDGGRACIWDRVCRELVQTRTLS